MRSFSKTVDNRKSKFASLTSRLERTEVEHNDALKVIASRDTEQTFHYVDPPYIQSDQGHYKGYTEADFEALLQLLSQVKGKFMLSSYPSDLVDRYVKKNGWTTTRHEKDRSAGKGNGRKIELLTVNYESGFYG